LKKKEIDIISQLVGDFNDNQIQNLIENIETYIHPDLSMFIPIYRYCDYAVSPNHSHPAYSFIYNISQKGRVIVNGKNKNNPLEDSSFICAFSPGIKHQEIIEEGFSNYIAVFIGKDYFEDISKSYNIPINLKIEGDFFAADENLLYLLKLLMLEYNTKKHQYEKYIKSLNNLITHQFIRVILGVSEQSSTINTSNKVDLAIAFMHDNLANKLTVYEIAAQVNTSSSHFAKIFKDYTNKTPIEYLSRIRLEKAKRLLKLSDKNLTEIAFDCGFSSSSYFSHSFIEGNKLTPSEYRKKFQLQENFENKK
jgi:AraC-like DNA-binding protein